jgi:hypothetical protein
MMNRRVFLLAAAGSLSLAHPIFAAASPEEEIARDLVGQGFAITSQRRTFLGRTRFTAIRGEIQREVVVDPSSGEILRDYSNRAEGSTRTVRAGNRNGADTGSGSGSSGGGESPSGGGESPSGGGESSSGGGESPSTGGETGGKKDGVKK